MLRERRKHTPLTLQTGRQKPFQVILNHLQKQELATTLTQLI